MNARLPACVFALELLVCPVTGLAQVRDRPAPTETPAAVGTVEGRVVINVNGQPVPVRRARVILAAGQIATDADTDGNFRFERVPAGRYQLAAQKPGFVPGAAPVVVALARRQTASVRLSMLGGAALEGRVLGVDGKPVANLVVSADRLSQTPTGYATVDMRCERTDDLGRFRVHTLPPGRYRLHAAAPPQSSGDELFYPGTPNEHEAAIITLAAGQMLQELDFTVAARLAASSAPEIEPGDLVPDNVAPRVAGRITSADREQPLANAQIILGCTSPPGASRLANTDSDGRFQFFRVPAGLCTLTVTADGHVKPQVGANWRPNKVIDVKAGEAIANANVVMAPVRAIEGRVLDEFGDPVPGVVIEILSRQLQLPPMPIATSESRSVTDDRGWFRMYGLGPADYYLRARTGLFGVSMSQVSSLNVDSPGGFATTFYPGTRTVADASPVRLGPSADAVDLTFALVPTQVTSVTGVVLDPNGRLVPRANVILQADGGDAAGLSTVNTAASAAGIFRYDRVPDGTYLLRTRSADHSGHLTVTVPPSSSGVNVTLAVRPLARTRGRVTFEGGRPSDRIVIMVLPTERLGLVSGVSMGLPVDAAGNFESRHSVSRGVIRVQARQIADGMNGPPDGWAVKSVVLNGQDITDVPLDFQAADVAGLEVTLTKRIGSVQGAVFDGENRVIDGVVVLFSTDADQWTSWSRQLWVAPLSAPTGAFDLKNLLPGQYLAAAVKGRMSPALIDAAWLARLRPAATAITISEGVNEPLRLQLAIEPTGIIVPR